MKLRTWQEHKEQRLAHAKANNSRLLTIEVQIRNDGHGGMIYSPEMKCEFPSIDLANDVADITQEYINLLESEQ